MFKQKSDSPAAGPPPADAVQQARTRARHRLIGAVVLLAIGIIGFPLVFETQPRPIPIDIPIEIPRKEAMPPLAAPSTPLATTRPPLAATTRDASAGPAARRGDEVITESRSDAGRDVTPAPRVAPSASATPAPPALAASRPIADGERARALLEGRSPAADETQRFVVQVGAFADAESAREARQRVEKLGLKTYTQVAQTPAGDRIRVRVGPFASRDEAETALARTKAAGLGSVVLKL